MTISRMKRSPFSAFVAVLLLSVLTHCELPPGCGPGDIPSNPLASNLIGYTKPASGAILFQEDFTELKVKLLRPIDKGTFSVADDVRLFEISNFWEADREEVPYPGGAGVVFSQAPWVCPGASCDQIDLVMNSSTLEPLRHYRIRILGTEAADPANPGVRPVTLISTPPDDGAVALVHDVDIIIGIGKHDPQAKIPSLLMSTDPVMPFSCFDKDSEKFNTPECLVGPHQRLAFPFCGLMGYTYFDFGPTLGLNLGNSVERVTLPVCGFTPEATVLWSDSNRGLIPGSRYEFDFPSVEPPEGMGVPRTTDRLGNPLAESYHFELNTAHVRIMFPDHEPCFSVNCLPDLWYKLDLYSVENPWFAVEATPSVYRLSATGPDGTVKGVVFEDVSLKAGRTKNSYPTIQKTCPEDVPYESRVIRSCTSRQSWDCGSKSHFLCFVAEKTGSMNVDAAVVGSLYTPNHPEQAHHSYDTAYRGSISFPELQSASTPTPAPGSRRCRQVAAGSSWPGTSRSRTLS